MYGARPLAEGRARGGLVFGGLRLVRAAGVDHMISVVVMG